MLPSGYTQLEYIQATGSQSIDLGIVPSTIGRLRCKVNYQSTARQCLFGSWGSVVKAAYMIGYINSSKIYLSETNVIQGVTPTGTDISVSINTDYFLDQNFIDGYYSCNDTKTHTLSGYPTSTRGAYLFCSNDSDDGRYIKASCKLYFFEIYNRSGNLIHEYIPCKRNSDNKVGVYDTVAGSFIAPNLGTLIAGPAITPNDNYLCFEAVDNTTVKFSIDGSLDIIPVVYYSLDKSSWSKYIFGTYQQVTVVSLSVGQKIYFKGTNYSFSNYNCTIRFLTTGKVKSSGNIMSLIDSNCVSETINGRYCFNKLFYSQSLLEAPELPAITLSEYCYSYMFYSCSLLLETPQLPATNLARLCYNYMFTGCRSLVQASDLPATTLKTSCYSYMFYGCTSLVEAPRISATTLDTMCCQYMFKNCTSLLEAPELPATSIASSCYEQMFYGCTLLTEPPLLPATILKNNCYKNMFYGCTGIKMSETQTGSYAFNYKIPSSGEIENPVDTALVDMFTNTGGSFVGTPEINKVYYYSLGTTYTFEYLSGPNGLVSSTKPNGSYLDGTEITLSALPDTHYHFSGWSNGSQIVSLENPYTFELNSDTSLIGIFEEDNTYSINISSNIEGNNVWVSSNKVYSGESVTLKAREIANYTFSKWSNESTSNPLIITVNTDISLSAIYTPNYSNDTVYDWYAYIKDQTNINGRTKAYLRVSSFDIKQDLITTSNSTINFTEELKDISLGDILCLYNPKGIVRYYGVIKSISEKSVQCAQMQSFYKGNWYRDNYSTATSIEEEFAHLLDNYAKGFIKGSSYQDMLQYNEKAPLLVKTGSTTSGNLTTADEKEVIDMETFIYSLYENYQIILDFNIPFGTWNIGDENGGSVTIKKPNYETIKIGNNTKAIIEISPTNEISETNKLIIFYSNGTYRETDVYTNSGIVKEPSVHDGRISRINTKIVFSDDPIEDLIKENLPDEMFNHKITFNLLLDNNLYKFDDFKLGTPLEIYKDEEKYETVLTGIEMSKEENRNVVEAKFICGNARTELSKKLARRFGVI